MWGSSVLDWVGIIFQKAALFSPRPHFNSRRALLVLFYSLSCINREYAHAVLHHRSSNLDGGVCPLEFEGYVGSVVEEGVASIRRAQSLRKVTAMNEITTWDRETSKESL